MDGGSIITGMGNPSEVAQPEAGERLVVAVQELSLARDLAAVTAVVRLAAREMTGADGAS